MRVVAKHKKSKSPIHCAGRVRDVRGRTKRAHRFVAFAPASLDVLFVSLSTKFVMGRREEKSFSLLKEKLVKKGKKLRKLTHADSEGWRGCVRDQHSEGRATTFTFPPHTPSGCTFIPFRQGNSLFPATLNSIDMSLSADNYTNTRATAFHLFRIVAQNGSLAVGEEKFVFILFWDALVGRNKKKAHMKREEKKKGRRAGRRKFFEQLLARLYDEEDDLK